MLGIFKKKLHNKVLVLSALPDNRDSFYKTAKSEKSDFFRSLCVLYDSTDPEVVWHNYKSTAKSLANTFNSLRQRGAEILSYFTIQDLQKLPDYDIVIVIAHHSDDSDEIELSDGCVKTMDIVNSIPEQTEAIIDLTSCYSDYLIPRLKGRIPHSRIIGIDTATSLPFRLFLLEKTIDAIAVDISLTYIDALKITLSSLPSSNCKLKVKEEHKVVYLGGKDIRSTVAAPFRAYKGENFIVSVFIHKEENKDEVELLAKAIDEDAEIRSSKKISVRIKKNDKIDFQLSIPDNIKDGFTVDRQKQTIRWDGDTNSVEFTVSVAAECRFLEFIGRIHVSINQEPQFDMQFKTKIIGKEVCSQHPSINSEYADIAFIPFDKIREKEDAKSLLVSRLKVKIEELTEALSGDNSTQDTIRRELDMCNKCLELIMNAPNTQHPHKDVLKVFISSTSDMKGYRDAIRERVLALGMYPDMYELWGQDNDYPRDVCCRHVLESDIFISILGPKYGYVEPIWDKSMTEIEYRIASNAGIPILIYIMKDCREKVEELSEKEKGLAVRQLNFIEELSAKRMVSIFPNEISLALLADPELLTLKHTLQS